MGTIITAATIMAIYMNSASDIRSQYCYNADIENGKVTTMYVFDKNGESLSGKLEYRYTYDELGRVTSKTVYRRAVASSRMKPESRYSFTYMADGYTVEHSRWNDRQGGFDRADSRIEYRYAGQSAMSVTTYELSANGSEMTKVGDMLAMTPVTDMLLAETR